MVSLTPYALPFAIAMVADGIESIYRSIKYRRNRKIIEEFRGELKAHAEPRYDYGVVLPLFKNPEVSQKCLDTLIENVGISRENIVGVDDYSNDENQTFYAAQQKGINVLKIDSHEKDIRKVRAQLKGAEFLRERGKKHIITLDSDCFLNCTKEDLDYAIEEMETLGLDVMAGQVLPKLEEDSNLLERIQMAEYKQAMRAGRGSMYRLKKWRDIDASSHMDLRSKYTVVDASQLCVSGAFGIFKPDDLIDTIKGMKKYGGGEDCEITQRLMSKKKRIGYHDGILVDTEAPKDLKTWIEQRDFWGQFMSYHLHDSKKVRKGILKENPEKMSPNFDAGGNAFRIQALRDIYIHPLKVASFPFVVMDLPLMGAFSATYGALNLFTSRMVKKKDEKMDMMAEFMLPFYRMGQLVLPTSMGYAKQFGRWFRFKKRKKNRHEE